MDRQVFARGLYYVVENGAEASRTFEFENDKGNSFPNRKDSSYEQHSEMGFDYGIDVFGGGDRRHAMDWLGPADSVAVWEIYVEQKLQAWRTYAATFSKESPVWCL